MARVALPPSRAADRGHPARMEGVQAEEGVRVAHESRDHDTHCGEHELQSTSGTSLGVQTLNVSVIQ